MAKTTAFGARLLMCFVAAAILIASTFDNVPGGVASADQSLRLLSAGPSNFSRYVALKGRLRTVKSCANCPPHPPVRASSPHHTP
eukprot:scaffold100531_cov35-Prasinocladus_malaysianus.AAC.2